MDTHKFIINNQLIKMEIDNSFTPEEALAMAKAKEESKEEVVAEQSAPVDVEEVVSEAEVVEPAPEVVEPVLEETVE